MASSLDKSFDSQKVTDNECVEETVESNKEQKESILLKEALLKSNALKIKKFAASKRKAKPTATGGTKTISNSMKRKNLPKTISRATNKGKKMPEVNNNKNFTTKDMIIKAVSDLNDKKGSSTIAIRKYVTNRYGMSQQRLPRITKLLKTANEKGWLVQTSGTGASAGSYFKLPTMLKKDVKVDKKKSKIKDIIKKKLSYKNIQSKSNKLTETIKKKTIVSAKKKKI